MSTRLITGMILPSVGVAALALASAASAQQGGGPPAGAATTGGPRVQDVAAANREVDSDYNTLAGRGVEVIDKSRADSKQKTALAAPAAAVDLVAGASVRDVNGTPIATIETLEADGAVVRSEGRLAKLPLDAFGKDDAGLLLAITADEFRAAVAQTAVPAQQEPQFVAATPSDMIPGAAIRDIDGVPVATVAELVESGVVVLADGKKVKLGLESFAKDESGLLIGITASEFKAAIGASGPARTGG